MKLQTKLGLSLFAFGAAIVVCAVMIAYWIGILPKNEADGVRIAALLLMITILIAGLSYLIAVSFCRRVHLLVDQAEEVRIHPALHTIHIPGPKDELVTLAETINTLKTQLTKGEEVRNQLVADVAHELRTPVAIIRGHLETMLAGAAEPSKENLHPLLDETKRMTRLIQDLRDLSLAEAGKLELDRSWVNFSTMLEDIISIMELEAETKAVAIRLDGEWNGEMYCDASRIKQVLINLIGNAIRYVPPVGEVKVSYIHDSGRLQIEVTDNGPGIAPERLPYIFKRFYRVEDSRNRMLGGTGLGLAIAREFVAAHGGSIEVKSEVGQGTAFIVSLPAFPANA